MQSAIFNGVGHALTCVRYLGHVWLHTFYVILFDLCSWENVWGIWNGVTPRGDAQIARASAVMRYFQPLMVTLHFAYPAFSM